MKEEAGLLLYFLFSNTALTKLPLRESSPGEKLAQSYIRNAYILVQLYLATNVMTLFRRILSKYIQPLLSKLNFYMLTLISECDTRISGIQ